MHKIILTFIIFIILAGLCASCPWLTPNMASQLAEQQFNQAWDGVIDGCGTSGNEYGVKASRKVPFGVVVTLDYQCGLVAPGEPPLHTSIYVSFVGVAFGYPKP